MASKDVELIGKVFYDIKSALRVPQDTKIEKLADLIEKNIPVIYQVGFYPAVIYQRSATIPSTPEGGSWTFDPDEHTSTFIAPDGWKTDISATETEEDQFLPIWQSNATFDSQRGISGPISGWTIPARVSGVQGASGSDGINGANGSNGKDGKDGKDGTGIQIKGKVATYEELPTTAEEGDCWVVEENGHFYSFDGDDWIDLGVIKGDPGTSYQMFLKYGKLVDGEYVFVEDLLEAEYLGTFVVTDPNPDIHPEEDPSNYSWVRFVGQDGFGRQFIFIGTEDENAPDVPDVTPETYDDIPIGWSDDLGLTTEMPYWWMCHSECVNGVWTEWTGDTNGKALLYAKAGEKGTDGENGNDAVVYELNPSCDFIQIKDGDATPSQVTFAPYKVVGNTQEYVPSFTIYCRFDGDEEFTYTNDSEPINVPLDKKLLSARWTPMDSTIELTTNITIITPGKDGIDGKIAYPAGEWEAKTYEQTDTTTPYIIYDSKYYMLNAESATADDIPSISDKWVLMDSFESIYTKLMIADNGQLGKFYFNTIDNVAYMVSEAGYLLYCVNIPEKLQVTDLDATNIGFYEFQIDNPLIIDKNKALVLNKVEDSSGEMPEKLYFKTPLFSVTSDWTNGEVYVDSLCTQYYGRTRKITQITTLYEIQENNWIITDLPENTQIQYNGIIDVFDSSKKYFVVNYSVNQNSGQLVTNSLVVSRSAKIGNVQLTPTGNWEISKTERGPGSSTYTFGAGITKSDLIQNLINPSLTSYVKHTYLSPESLEKITNMSSVNLIQNTLQFVDNDGIPLIISKFNKTPHVTYGVEDETEYSGNLLSSQQLEHIEISSTEPPSLETSNTILTIVKEGSNKGLYIGSMKIL